MGADIKGNLTHTCTCTHWTQRMKTSTKKITAAAGPKHSARSIQVGGPAHYRGPESSGCSMMLPRKTHAAESWGHHLKGRHPQRWWTTNKLKSCETAGAWHRRWLINESRSKWAATEDRTCHQALGLMRPSASSTLNVRKVKSSIVKHITKPGKELRKRGTRNPMLETILKLRDRIRDAGMCLCWKVAGKWSGHARRGNDHVLSSPKSCRRELYLLKAKTKEFCEFMLE